jgi:hypothetical protein
MLIRFLVFGALLCLTSCTRGTAETQSFGSQTRTRVATNTKSVDAEKFPGADIGAKINAADAALGANAGDIRVSSGGNIATQINISSKHTLRIVAGNYTATTNSSVIRLKDDASLQCSDWNAVLRESTGKVGASSPFTIVRDYNGDVSNHAASQNITINGCHFKGARSDFNSVSQTVGLGNCKNCKVTNNWLDATRTIGIQAGGGSANGNYASNVSIAHNRLTEVASQNIAVTNGENVEVDQNEMKTPGQLGGPGVSVIDVEPNAGDRLKNIRITRNTIDATQSTTFTVTNGMAIQNYNTKDYGPVEVIGNKLVGATHSTPHNDYIIYAGILVNNAPNVHLRDNYIQRTPWGIRFNPGSNHFIIAGNELASCGSGSSYAISIIDSSDGIVVNNYLHEGVGDQVSVGLTATQIVENTAGGPIARNVFANNRGAVHHLIGGTPDSAPNLAALLNQFGTPFSGLAAAEDGRAVYCSDCRAGAQCTSGGNGRWARRENGRWRCD